MCENHMVLPWADDEPVEEVKEMDPDEWRELFGESDRKAREITDDIMTEFDAIIDIIKKHE